MRYGAILFMTWAVCIRVRKLEGIAVGLAEPGAPEGAWAGHDARDLPPLLQTLVLERKYALSEFMHINEGGLGIE